MRTRLLIGILLSAVFLYFFLRNLDLRSIWDVMRRGNPWWLVLCASINLFNYYFRALRWRYFLEPIKKCSLWNLTSTTVMGFATSSVFPAKIGEVVRPYLLGNKENISRSSCLATVVIERVFDTLSVVFMLVIYLLFLVRPEQLSSAAAQSLDELKRAGLLIFAGVLGVVVFLYYLKTRPTMVRKMTGKIAKILPKKVAHSLDEVLDSFIRGLSILHDPRLLFKISYWSIAFWIIIAAGFWAGVRAYIPDFAFTNTFLILILLAIGIAVPTPGAVGSYHLALKIGLTRFFGVSEAEAGAVALVSHFIAFFPVTVIGLFLLWREGLSTTKISRIAETRREDEKINA